MKAQPPFVPDFGLSRNASAGWALGAVSALYLEGEAPTAAQSQLEKSAEQFVLVLQLKGTLRIGETPALDARRAVLLPNGTSELSLHVGPGPLQSLLLFLPPEYLEGWLDKESDLVSPEPLDLDLGMHNAVQAMLACRFEGEVRRVFLLGKCLELLALYAEARDRTRRTRFVYCHTEYDRERLLFAREYLLQRYDLPPTLDELARIAGLNVFKLKNGFRELFGKPVFAWLNDYKMELAHRELAQGLKSASQLAFDLGYSSLSHFSRAFRRQFGYPPTSLNK